jgi:protease-4
MTLGFSLPVCSCLLFLVISIGGTGWLAAQVDPEADTGSGQGVGVLDLNGPILQGTGGDFAAGSRDFIEDLEWLEKNPDVRAILIRANSPGGDANASDLMWRALSEVEKPVVVYVSGLCASGCYYIAMGADSNEIYATPNSLIGSIGVVSTFFNIEGLAEDVGVQVQVVATGENKDFGSPFRPLSAEEEAYWREQIAVVLENFIQVVAGGRPNLSEGDIREMASGRVWTSSIAQEMGLIDGLMYEDQAMDHAAQLGGISGDNYRIILPPYEPTLGDLLFGDGGAPAFQAGVEVPNTQELSNMLQQGPIQYRYYGPYGGLPADN